MPSVMRLGAVKAGRYALAVMLFGTPAINSGLTKELTPPSRQTGATVISGHEQGASDRGMAVQSKVEAKGKADAMSDKRVGTPEDSRGIKSDGIKGEPHAVPGGGAGTKGMSNGGTQSQHNGTGTNPIDTGITVQGPPKSESAIKSHDWNKAKIAVPSGNSRDHGTSSRDGVERNAIGVLMPSRKAAKVPDASSRGFAPVATAASTAGAALKNLATGRPDAGISRPASTKANTLPVNTEMDHSVLNGTGIGHPGSGTGMIGGATKYATGGINGTSFKHP